MPSPTTCSVSRPRRPEVVQGSGGDAGNTRTTFYQFYVQDDWEVASAGDAQSRSPLRSNAPYHDANDQRGSFDPGDRYRRDRKRSGAIARLYDTAEECVRAPPGPGVAPERTDGASAPASHFLHARERQPAGQSLEEPALQVQPDLYCRAVDSKHHLCESVPDVAAGRRRAECQRHLSATSHRDT